MLSHQFQIELNRRASWWRPPARQGGTSSQRPRPRRSVRPPGCQNPGTLNLAAEKNPARTSIRNRGI